MSFSCSPQNDDFIEFARYLGLDGVDADLFYEQYYDLDNEEYDSVLDVEFDHH